MPILNRIIINSKKYINATATSADIRQDAIAYSNNEIQVGSMQENIAENINLSFGNNYKIREGYHSGVGKVVAESITGKTSDANVLASDVVSGKTVYGNTSKLVGSMTNRGAINASITTRYGSYTIPAGWHNGSGKVTVSIPNLVSSNIVTGYTVAGISGAYLGKCPNIDSATVVIDDPEDLKNKGVTSSLQVVTINLQHKNTITIVVTVTFS